MEGPKLQQRERQTENKTVVHFVTSLHDCDVPNFHIRVLACENIRFSSFFFDEDVSKTCSAAKTEEKRMFSQANTCIMEEANKRGRNFLSFSPWIWFLGTQLQERSLTFDKVSWNNRDEDWKIVNLLLKGNFQRLRFAVLSTKATKGLLSSLKYNNNRSGPLSISKCEREFKAVLSLKHHATSLSFIIILKCL